MVVGYAAYLVGAQECVCVCVYKSHVFICNAYILFFFPIRLARSCTQLTFLNISSPKGWCWRCTGSKLRRDWVQMFQEMLFLLSYPIPQCWVPSHYCMPSIHAGSSA